MYVCARVAYIHVVYVHVCMCKCRVYPRCVCICMYIRAHVTYFHVVYVYVCMCTCSVYCAHVCKCAYINPTAPLKVMYRLATTSLLPITVEGEVVSLFLSSVCASVCAWDRVRIGPCADRSICVSSSCDCVRLSVHACLFCWNLCVYAYCMYARIYVYTRVCTSICLSLPNCRNIWIYGYIYTCKHKELKKTKENAKKTTSLAKSGIGVSTCTLKAMTHSLLLLKLAVWCDIWC